MSQATTRAQMLFTAAEYVASLEAQKRAMQKQAEQKSHNQAQKKTQNETKEKVQKEAQKHVQKQAGAQEDLGPCNQTGLFRRWRIWVVRAIARRHQEKRKECGLFQAFKNWNPCIPVLDI
ncbi:Protein of unknown function [Pyronema omphalodes CBS 100304]|uniref:Uncharacterized protein n=1 Tax=Pyronema omphalodes (strain CBS 100304) TaxID=1076935 RepID=U4L6W3_PYROM|nr:Protein of unknown function [Pyronema omphalodes CBS 100304]